MRDLYAADVCTPIALCSCDCAVDFTLFFMQRAMQLNMQLSSMRYVAAIFMRCAVAAMLYGFNGNAP
jgi:hypothetical protein